MKIIKQEFWPDWLFNMPLYIWYIIRSIQIWWVGRVIATNPWITNWWFIWETKRESLKYIDPKYLPRTIFWEKDIYIESIIWLIKAKNISYPLIVKADIWEKSQKIKIINTERELINIQNNNRWDLLIQEYIQTKSEYWISYAKMPNQKNWSVIGITQRKLLDLTWDWRKTLEQLVIDNDRAIRYIKILKKQNANIRNTIIEKWEIMRVMPFGAHSRGTIFYDNSDLISNKLSYIIDKISESMPGFYIWRYDIKADSINDIENWRFWILEVNGIWGIPAHMYDPNNSLIKWYSILFNYRNQAFEIAKNNIKKHNIKIPNYKYMYNLIKWDL